METVAGDRGAFGEAVRCYGQSNRTKVDVRGPDTGNGSHGRIWQFSVHDLYAWHDLGQPQLTTIRHVEEAASDDEVRLAAARVSMVQA
jgi:hypothetical protein